MAEGAKRIAVITDDVLAARMAGPAIRALHIAEALAARQHTVELISTASCNYTHPGVTCRYVSWGRLRAAVTEADVVIFQGFVSYHAPWLLAGEQILVIDLYDPIHLEQLEQLADRSVLEQRATIDHTTRVLNEQVSRGDFFLCASEQQRALWLGQLAALGRLNIANYRSDVTLRSLIDVCPFGISAEPPTQTRHAIKGGVPGIGVDDTVVIWAGGIYNWFDPVTLIRAVDRVRAQHDDIRLFFLGTKHPNPDVTGDEMALAARKLADELGLTGTHVFFNDGWVEYERPAELPAGRRCRGQHAFRQYRDGLLVPHQDARLPVGGAADDQHRGRRVRCADRRRGPRCRGPSGRRRATGRGAGPGLLRRGLRGRLPGPGAGGRRAGSPGTARWPRWSNSASTRTGLRTPRRINGG